MAGSPVLQLRRVQDAVTSAAGAPVTSLDLVAALVAHMDASGYRSIRLERSSLKVYLSQLRNWKLMDDALLAGGLSRRLPDLRERYASYVKAAEALQLVPASFSTFRLRAYLLPGEVSRERSA